MDDWVGRVLSKVRVERLIGRGGMADVYIGRHTTLDRPMAVKILHAHMTVDPDLRRRFEEEAKSVAALRHPNIVQVIDFDVVDDRPYIIMELLEGMSLGQYLRELHSLGHTLPLPVVSRLIDGIASALDYAHQRGIVHRDVKPANIVLRKGRDPLRAGLPLGDDVQPILTDFGVARIATATTRTASGTVLGTPAYMSPEQIQGMAVDARSDIYSLGVILYEMLAGRLPFDPETDTPASILYKHVHERPPKLANLAPNLQAVVDRALAKDREARYQQAGEFARDLQRAVAGQVPTAAAASAPQAAPTAVPTASGMPPTGTPATPPSPVPTKGRGGLSGIALVGAFALGAVVLAGGVFLGVNILRNLAGAPEPTRLPEPTAVSAEAGTGLPTLEATQAATGAPAAAPTLDLSTPVGSILIGDDFVSGVLRGIAAPESGMQYHVWLVGEGQDPLELNLVGNVSFSGDQLTIEYMDTVEGGLFTIYNQLLVSAAPPESADFQSDQVRYQGELDPQLAAQIKQWSEIKRNAAELAQLPTQLSDQATHFQSHANLAINEIDGSNLQGAKMHSEHTINIAEGSAGEFYGDWDGDGSTVNPGDDVGLLNYLHLLQSAALGFGEAQQLAGRVDPLPDQVAAEASRLIDASIAVRDAARQVATADEIGVVNQLGLRDQLASANAIHTDIQSLIDISQPLQLQFSFSVFPITPPE